jgi:hypothetical protein
MTLCWKSDPSAREEEEFGSAETLTDLKGVLMDKINPKRSVSIPSRKYIIMPGSFDAGKTILPDNIIRVNREFR